MIMNPQFDAVQKLGKSSFDAARTAFGGASTATRAIVVETVDYARKPLEQGVATFEKLAGVKSRDKAVDIQTEYVRSAYKGFVNYATKTRELYTKLAQDSLAPFSALRSATEATIFPAKSAACAK
jgi:hypothetical protein